MSFEFATAGRIIFGSGRRALVAKEAASLGRRAFVVAGRSASRIAPLLSELSGEGLEAVVFNVAGEPTVGMVQEAFEKAAGCDLVIAMGGGSVLDCGKAVSALLTNSGDLMDYLEVIGKGVPLAHPTVPMIAIPTTSGTGSEVTKNAVVGSPEHKVKVSMRSPFMVPDLVVVDPELTLSLPKEATACSGLDALTQLMEAFVSVKANPFTDAICRDGMARAAKALPKVCEDGSDLEAREDMALASLYSGMALANAGLGAVHGFAGPLGGMIEAPHGAICASLLPHVMAVNVEALKARMPGSDALIKYEEMAKILTGDEGATAEDGVVWVSDLCGALELKSLGELGLTEGAVAEAVEKGRQASSMKGNPVVLTDGELEAILFKAF